MATAGAGSGDAAAAAAAAVAAAAPTADAASTAVAPATPAPGPHSARGVGDDMEQDRGESIVGPKFLQYWRENGEDPFAHVPVVEVAVKVYELSQVFAKENSFYAKFCLQLDWEDRSLPPPGEVDEINFEEHFIPRFEINNPGEQIPEAEKGRTIRRKPNDGNHFRVSMTEKYYGNLLSRVDVSDFPYDIQMLELAIKSRPCHTASGKKLYIVLRDPVTFRFDEGHSIAPGANWNPQWHLLGITGGSMTELEMAAMRRRAEVNAQLLVEKQRTDRALQRSIGFEDSGAQSPPPRRSTSMAKKAVAATPDLSQLRVDNVSKKTASKMRNSVPKADRYTVQIKIARASDDIMVNIVFILCVVVVLSLTAYGVDIEEIFDRSSIVLTALLTVVAVKWIIQDDLPRVPYLTMLDAFLLVVISQLFVAGILFWVFAELFKNFACAADEVNADSTQGQFCSRIVFADVVIGVLQFVVFIVATVFLVLQRRSFERKKSEKFLKLCPTTDAVGFEFLSNREFCYSYRRRHDALPPLDEHQPLDGDMAEKRMHLKPYKEQLARGAVGEGEFEGTQLHSQVEFYAPESERERGSAHRPLADWVREWAAIKQDEGAEAKQKATKRDARHAAFGERKLHFLQQCGVNGQREMDALAERFDRLADTLQKYTHEEASKKSRWDRFSPTAEPSPSAVARAAAARDEVLLQEYVLQYLKHRWDADSRPSAEQELSRTLDSVKDEVGGNNHSISVF